MMSVISYETTFDAGHRIVGHKGKCARLHGHTYRVHITCTGEVVPPGFVVDFGDFKEIINEWDHRMLLWHTDELATAKLEAEGVILLPFNPTAENMAEYLATEIDRRYDLDRVEVKLWETPKCMARYVIE
jgi:6-pyruvoyltetrahydropterin/6-carboxytetrahydropterin synthase